MVGKELDDSKYWPLRTNWDAQPLGCRVRDRFRNSSSGLNLKHSHEQTLYYLALRGEANDERFDIEKSLLVSGKENTASFECTTAND